MNTWINALRVLCPVSVLCTLYFNASIHFYVKHKIYTYLSSCKENVCGNSGTFKILHTMSTCVPYTPVDYTKWLALYILRIRNYEQRSVRDVNTHISVFYFYTTKREVKGISSSRRFSVIVGVSSTAAAIATKRYCAHCEFHDCKERCLFFFHSGPSHFGFIHDNGRCLPNSSHLNPERVSKIYFAARHSPCFVSQAFNVSTDLSYANSCANGMEECKIYMNVFRIRCVYGASLSATWPHA